MRRQITAIMLAAAALVTQAGETAWAQMAPSVQPPPGPPPAPAPVLPAPLPVPRIEPLAPPPVAATRPRRDSLTIVNGSERAIARVFVQQDDSANWAEDVLERDVLAPGASFRLPLTGDRCRYDLRVEFEDGSVEEKAAFDVCAGDPARFGDPRVAGSRGFTLSRPGPRDGAAPTATASPPRPPAASPPRPPAASPPRPPAASLPRAAARPRSGAARPPAARALPRFPWPAPKPVKQVAVPVASVGGPGATLDQVLTALERGIARASDGYDTGVFGGPPNGFVLLTRMERIQSDASPFPGVNRFTLKGNPRAGLLDMLASLIAERPGYFRVIAFVVAGELAIDPDKPVSAVPNVRDGAARLPPELGRQKLGNRQVFALVYAYERPDGAAYRPWTEGAPSALQHLRASGIAPALGL